MAEPETPIKTRAKRVRKPVAASDKPKRGIALPADLQSSQPPAPAKPKIGRPSKYDPRIAQIICEHLSDGIPLREICRMEGMPAWRTIYDWMYRDDAAVANGGGVGLSAAIARAREVGYDAIAEECLHIADNPQLGQKQVLGDEGATTTVEDMLGHRKLQIETRLKLLAKWSPNRYGDRVQVAGDAENPIRVEAESQADRLFAELLKNLELRRLESSGS